MSYSVAYETNDYEYLVSEIVHDNLDAAQNEIDQLDGGDAKYFIADAPAEQDKKDAARSKAWDERDLY